MATIIKSIELRSIHAGSDKVYNVQLCEVDGGFVVNYQNGRRGGTLATGTKTKSPVANDKAQTIYERLVREKINGDSHYTIVGSDATSAASLVTEKRLSGVLPMLPSAVDESRVESLLSVDGVVMQEKFDGQRVLLIVTADGGIIGSNRLGFVRPLPNALIEVAELSGLLPGSVFDGELVGETYHCFDLLRDGGMDRIGESYERRREAMQIAWQRCVSPLFRVVPTFYFDKKGRALDRLRIANAEGVIFRDLKAPYTAGRTLSCLKYKFTESATLLVDGHEPAKRSVYLGSFDPSGRRVTMGKVTIPPNFTIPEVDDIVEVQYLYAFPGTHALAQPVYKGVRSDQTQESCILSQLKYKAANNEDDEAEAA